MTSDQWIAQNLPAWPQHGEPERTALLRALDQGQWWRVGGSEVDEFELEFAEYHGAARAIAVTNGTHALELALELLGVGPGTEVVVPAFTFIASSLAVQRLGAAAVPVDVDPVTYCMDADAAAAAVTSRTRAIMPVHMAGHIADVDALGKVAADTGTEILHDAAHAHGARWRGRRVGELGGIAAFSFQNGKLMTGGEGGALLLADDNQYADAFMRHSCGRPVSDTRYFHQTTGSNFRMNEFTAAVLRCQLARLDEQIDVREQRAAQLTRLLAELPGITPQGRDERCDRDPHYMMMFRAEGFTEERRNALVQRLVARGVPAFVNFRTIYRTDTFWAAGSATGTVEELAERCPNSETLHTEGVWLHHRLLLGSEELIERTAAAIAAELAAS
jgi:3-amino-5-hydroxybenzoate synthase